MKYLVTLDITVEAESRNEAFEQVEKILGSQTFCLYDAEAVEHSLHPTNETLPDLQALSTPQPLATSQALSTPLICG